MCSCSRPFSFNAHRGRERERERERRGERVCYARCYLHIIQQAVLRLTFINTGHLTLAHNFAKCWQILLPRDATRKRGHCCRSVSVRPSVRPFVSPVSLPRWWIVSKPLKISSNFFLGPVARPIILVFWPPAPVPNSKENPFSGA